MYITIRLVDKSGILLDKIYRENNTSFLLKYDENQAFPCLSLVEPDDPSFFDSEDMDEILHELQIVYQQLENIQDRQHVKDIMKLAEKCKVTPNTLLIFQ